MKGLLKKIIPPKIVVSRLLRRNENFSSSAPCYYNDCGEKYSVVYLEDYTASPYGFVAGRQPRRIMWDRYNRELPIQVYSHLTMLYRERNINVRQYGFMLESEQIIPNEYEAIYSNDSKVNSLDCLFTHSERLLNKYDNAKFMPGGGVYIGTEYGGGQLDISCFEKKNKLISIVSSNKTMCQLHILRLEIAKEMIRKKIGNVMGTVVGMYVPISESLTNYMYSVAIENYQGKYYFTEKLLNCFASMTIPIYYGCNGIDKFFNIDGIIIIKEPTIESAMKAIRECSEHDYYSRKDAIFDNYNRVQKYLCCEDYLSYNYPNLFNLQ